MSGAWDDTQVSHRYADLGDVRLHYVEAGGGPLVVLLHGFPDFWYTWRHQIPALAAAGFRVVAPDMRGYNLSDKPRGVAAYSTEALVGDVAALIRHCGAERACLVGHDWGGSVAWQTAMLAPGTIERLAILNVPHPRRLLQGLRDPRQLARSWYIFFFQLPWLPEGLAAATRYALFRSALQSDPVRPGAFSAADIDRYVEAWSRPGAVGSGINYYRAALRQTPRQMQASLRVIDAPVLVIWGERDKYLGVNLADPEPNWVPDARVERLPDASHWVQHDRPERVSELLIEFFGPARESAGGAADRSPAGDPAPQAG